MTGPVDPVVGLACLNFEVMARTHLAALVAWSVDRLGLDRFDTTRAVERAAAAYEAKLAAEGRLPRSLVAELADGTRSATPGQSVALARELLCYTEFEMYPVRYLRGAA